MSLEKIMEDIDIGLDSRSDSTEKPVDEDSHHPTHEEGLSDEAVEKMESAEVEHTPTIMSKLQGSVDIPEEFKFANKMTFYSMLRNIYRGKSILITGPSGCGKSSLGKILAGITNKPFYAFNFGDTMNPSAKLLGDTKFDKDRGTWFKPSRFVSALKDDRGAFIMLDEVTRDRTGDLGNILMPVLDGQKYLALDESDTADTVSIDKGAFFFATAKELELLMIRTPTLDEGDGAHITDFARRIRELYKAEELNTAVSTRMCLTAAELVVDGMTLVDALKHVCLPFYPVVAGDDTERVRVIQVIQSMGEA